MQLQDDILDLSRQTSQAVLSPWFTHHLDHLVERGHFLPPDDLCGVGERLISQLNDYREQAGISTAVLGMSGGVDSALTAALLKAAGWRVIGYTLPIAQNPVETERGAEACSALGIEHLHLDCPGSTVV